MKPNQPQWEATSRNSVTTRFINPKDWRTDPFFDFHRNTKSMKTRAELHIVIDREGVRSVQIIGSPEFHPEGHDLYFKVRHLIPKLNQEIQNLLKSDEVDGNKEAH